MVQYFYAKSRMEEINKEIKVSFERDRCPLDLAKLPSRAARPASLRRSTSSLGIRVQCAAIYSGILKIP